MYKNKDKQREANRNAMKRSRQGITKEGITETVTKQGITEVSSDTTTIKATNDFLKAEGMTDYSKNLQRPSPLRLVPSMTDANVGKAVADEGVTEEFDATKTMLPSDMMQGMTGKQGKTFKDMPQPHPGVTFKDLPQAKQGGKSVTDDKLTELPFSKSKQAKGKLPITKGMPFTVRM